MKEIEKTINQYEDVFNHMVEKNTLTYNLQKASEEFQELSLVLLQKSLKPYKVKDNEVIEEIGDCIIRLKVLMEFFDNQLIHDRVKGKLIKYKSLKSTEGILI